MERRTCRPRLKSGCGSDRRWSRSARRRQPSRPPLPDGRAPPTHPRKPWRSPSFTTRTATENWARTSSAFHRRVTVSRTTRAARWGRRPSTRRPSSMSPAPKCFISPWCIDRRGSSRSRSPPPGQRARARPLVLPGRATRDRGGPGRLARRGRWDARCRLMPRRPKLLPQTWRTFEGPLPRCGSRSRHPRLRGTRLVAEFG